MLRRVLTGPSLTLAAVGFLSAQDVPTPESHFGFEIGSERNLGPSARRRSARKFYFQ